MEINAEVKKLLTMNLQIVEHIEKKISMFSKSAIVLSFIDCIFGILAIVCTSLNVMAFIASVSSLTVISVGGWVIQASKLRDLSKALRTLNIISLTWFVNKYRKYLNKEKKTKMTKSTLLQKILTTVIAVFGLGGVVVYFLPQFAPVAGQVTNYCAMAGEIIAVVSGIWLSQTSDKVLTNEEIAKIEEDKKNKQLAKDKALIEKNDKSAKKLEEAKARVAEAESKKV